MKKRPRRDPPATGKGKFVSQKKRPRRNPPGKFVLDMPWSSHAAALAAALATAAPLATAFVAPFSPLAPLAKGAAGPAWPRRDHGALGSFSPAPLTVVQPLQRVRGGGVANLGMAAISHKQVATGYAVAGFASAFAWFIVSYVALSFHPNAAINAACGLRHNALTMAQAWALPMPVGYAVFKSLHSAANNSWERLESATYKRLNLAVAFASLWLAAAVSNGPAFACGYSLFSPQLAAAAAAIHASTAALAFAVWAKSVGGGVIGLLPRLVRGLVGGLFCLFPLRPSDDPDQPQGDAALYSFSALGLFALTLLPLLVGFPMATIPAILGKRLSRAAAAFTLLAAVSTTCLKDAAERDRLNASTFITLRQGLALGAAGHLFVVFLKVAGVDGGGLLLPGNGLWEFYPSMVGAPKAALGMVFVYATLVVATWSKPAVSGQDAGGSSKASEAGFVPGTPTTYW